MTNAICFSKSEAAAREDTVCYLYKVVAEWLGSVLCEQEGKQSGHSRPLMVLLYIHKMFLCFVRGSGISQMQIPAWCDLIQFKLAFSRSQLDALCLASLFVSEPCFDFFLLFLDFFFDSGAQTASFSSSEFSSATKDERHRRIFDTSSSKFSGMCPSPSSSRSSQGQENGRSSTGMLSKIGSRYLSFHERRNLDLSASASIRTSYRSTVT